MINNFKINNFILFFSKTIATSNDFFKNTMKILILTLLLPQDYKSVMTRVKQQFTERTVTTIFFRGTVINRTIAFTHPAEKWSTLAFIWSRFWPNY